MPNAIALRGKGLAVRCITTGNAHMVAGKELTYCASPGMQAGLAKSVCVAAGGHCVVARDGYYLLSYMMIAFGVLLGLWYRILLPKLEALPLGAWRASKCRKR